MNKLWIYSELVLKIIKSLSKHRQSIHKFKNIIFQHCQNTTLFCKVTDLPFTCQKLLDFVWVSVWQIFIFWVLTIVICTLCTSTTKKGKKPYSCYLAGCITEKQFVLIMHMVIIIIIISLTLVYDMITICTSWRLLFVHAPNAL